MKKKYLMIPCVTAALMVSAVSTAFAAAEWRESGGEWYYYSSSGERATDTWKKSGSHMFYLDESGKMLRDALIEDNDNYYYVNSDGAMVSNEWRYLVNEDPGDGEEDMCWYYFQNTGKAVKSSGSGAKFKSITVASGDTKKYSFNEEGKLMYGWLNEDGEAITDDDAWLDGMYYAGEVGDGAVVTGQWRQLEAENSELEDDDFDGTHWFYFGSNGKKVTDTVKTINGRKYRFDENGATEFKWYYLATPSDATPSNLYYNQPDQCWQAKGWFKVVPSAEVDLENYEDDEAFWFYAKNNGELIMSQIKSINGYSYGFNDKGEMLHGLYKLTFDGKQIVSAEEIESEADMPKADEECDVYYFGDSPKEGVLKTGSATIEIDGEKYSYEFRTGGGTLRGAGYNGIYKDSILIKGRKLKAASDLKLEAFDYDDQLYLVNSSGKIQKNKTNIKDSEGMYYSTDKNGVITYSGSEKE